MSLFPTHLLRLNGILSFRKANLIKQETEIHQHQYMTTSDEIGQSHRFLSIVRL